MGLRGKQLRKLTGSLKGKERTVLDHVLPLEEAWGAARGILGGMKTPRGAPGKGHPPCPGSVLPEHMSHIDTGRWYMGKMEAKGFLPPLPRPQTRPIILSVSNLAQRGKISFQS